jgi:hypothetical protein
MIAVLGHELPDLHQGFDISQGANGAPQIGYYEEAITAGTPSLLLVRMILPSRKVHLVAIPL